MKVAILILAHKNKEQLERLIANLQHENVDIYIHLDRKASFEPADVKAQGICFTQRRFDVGLFEFSMVEAEIELIRTAKQHGNYQYYVMLSGQCYPLMSMERIYQLLCDQYPKPIISARIPTVANRKEKIFKHVCLLKRFKIKTYAILKKYFPEKVYQYLRYIPGGFVFAVSLFKELFVGSPDRRLKKMHLQGYQGSQWWMLPDTAIEGALSFYENKAFCSAIRECFSCDETFFQTAVMAEKEKYGIRPDELGDYINPMWYIIFDHGHPIILTKHHYGELMSSGMPFARKFDEKIDSEILDMIDSSRE